MASGTAPKVGLIGLVAAALALPLFALAQPTPAHAGTCTRQVNFDGSWSLFLTVERDAELNPVRVVVQYEDGRTFEVDSSGHAAQRLSATETAPVSEQEAEELRALYEAVANWDTGWQPIIPGVMWFRAYLNMAAPSVTAHLQGKMTFTWDDDRACAGSTVPVTCSYHGDPGASSLHIEGGIESAVQLEFYNPFGSNPVWDAFALDLGVFATEGFTGYALGESVSACDDSDTLYLCYPWGVSGLLTVSACLAGTMTGCADLQGSKIGAQIDSGYYEWTDESQPQTFCVHIPSSASGTHQVEVCSDYSYQATAGLSATLCVDGCLEILFGVYDDCFSAVCFPVPILDIGLNLGFNSPCVTCDIPVAADCPTPCEISYDPPSPTTDDMITFSPGACIFPTSADWDFGDGEMATGDPATHQYVMPGTYGVAATMCHSDGQCATCAVDVTVGKGANILPECGDPAIIAYLDVGYPVQPGVVAINREAVFTSNAYDPNPWGEIAYEWDFGDGGMGTGNPASHTYTVAGTYNVCVTLTDDQDGQTTCCMELTVLECVCDVVIDRTHCKMPAAGQIGQCKMGQIGARNMSTTESCEVVLRVSDNAGDVVFEGIETIAPSTRVRLRFDHCYTALEVGRNFWTWEVWPVECGELTPWNNIGLRKVNVRPGVRSGGLHSWSLGSVWRR